MRCMSDKDGRHMRRIVGALMQARLFYRKMFLEVKEDSSSQDPLSAASSCDCLPAERDGDVEVRNGALKLQQGSHVQRANRPVQNGGMIKLNGSLKNLPPSPGAAPSSAITDSQKPNRLHLTSTLSPTSSSPLCCPHCHFHSTLCCPCGQPDCPPFQSPASGPVPCSGPHAGTALSCPCCISTCTYSHPLPHHQASPTSLHHQCWQEHLQSQIHAPGIRLVLFKFILFYLLFIECSLEKAGI
ncbi:hypothetical protein XENOCAPTIV_026277 [Xenoophorus captivus]|uniref:Uncharacterized protein n=1 Tax=Xenoophorus captivus TaxID=1517983 RepID=A0ABV0RND6_9TELE